MRPLSVDDLDEEIRTAIEWDDETAIAALGAELDHLEAQQRRETTCLQAALWYAQQGLHVFALQPGSKIPHPRSRGCKDATTDPDLLRAWWTEHPGSNVAIATGYLVDVIDLDGPEANAWLLEVLDTLPPLSGKVSTPRAGGRHLYVKAVEGRGNRAGLADRVDYRGLGGYVVAPPSTTDVGGYVWTRPLDMAGRS